MNAFLRTWVPLATLLVACGSGETGTANRTGNPTLATGAGTGAGNSSGATTSTTGTTGTGSVGTSSTTGDPTGGTGPGTSTAGTTTGGVTGSGATGTATTGGAPTSGATSGSTSGGSVVTGSGGSWGTGGAGGGGGSSSAGAGGASSSDAGPIEAGPRPPPPIPPGLLTAGAWDDNQNFDWFDAYRSALGARQIPGILPVPDADFAAAREAAKAPQGPRQKLDISLVIDTTGSMGDEIRYLQSEFLAMSDVISTRYPTAEARWSLVLYKDTTDVYVTRQFDFSGDTQAFQANLMAQSAGGGGDFPEAPERGLAEMAKFGWRADATAAKIAFWVADAPHHSQNAQAFATTIGQIRAKGIHVYPVASSGVDEFTELTMRSAAQLTLGRYLFLTNDSGIGGPHKEPSIPCYFVTKLDAAMLRVIDIEMTGTHHEPAAQEILRNGGNPQQGSCSLPFGKTALVF